MKIGSIELTVSTYVYAAILLAMLIIVPLVAMSRWGAMREAWHAKTIINAAAEGGEAAEPGMEACRKLIAADPTKVPARMHLACLLARQTNYKEAKEVYEHVLDASKATPEEKSLAMVGAGISTCLDGIKDGVPAHQAEAEALFQKALGFKETPDALAAMALLKSWKAGASNAEVETFISKALSAEPAPAPALLEQLYRLQGAVLARGRKPIEASNAFRKVKAINPENNQVEDAGRLALLSALNEPGMDPAARKAAIQKLTVELDRFGKARGEAQQAIGMAWHAFKDQQDYLAPNGPFDQAKLAFKQMSEFNPRDARAYKNLNALLEERIADMAAELTLPVTGLKGESTPWTSTDKRPSYSDRFPKPDQDRLAKIQVLLRDEESNWKRCIDTAEMNKEDKADAKARLLSSLRRIAWITEQIDPISFDNSLKRAQDTATELAGSDDSGRGHYLLSLVQIERGDLQGARLSLLESAKRGFKSVEQIKLLGELDGKVRLADAGPMPNERQFGNAQLIRMTVDSPMGAAVLKGAKMTLNGKEVFATTYGTQLLYVAKDLTGETQSVRVTAGDATGTPIVFPAFKFGVDKDGPEWSVEPAPGAPLKSDAALQITLRDPSGIDWASLNVGMRAAKGAGAAPFDLNFIKDGKYSHSLPRIPAKVGEAVAKSPVVVGAPTSFPPGDYTLWIEVKDTLGNKLKADKTYVVK